MDSRNPGEEKDTKARRGHVGNAGSGRRSGGLPERDHGKIEQESQDKSGARYPPADARKPTTGQVPVEDFHEPEGHDAGEEKPEGGDGGGEGAPKQERNHVGPGGGQDDGHEKADREG